MSQVTTGTLGFTSMILGTYEYIFYRSWEAKTLVNLPLRALDNLLDIDLYEITHSVPDFMPGMHGWWPDFFGCYGLMTYFTSFVEPKTAVAMTLSGTALFIGAEFLSKYFPKFATYSTDDIYAILAAGALTLMTYTINHIFSKKHDSVQD